MGQVWKFVFETPRQVMDMPQYAKPLSVGWQDARVVLWAEVQPGRPNERRVFECCNTGDPLPETRREFVGTAVSAQNGIVWHVYEVLP